MLQQLQNLASDDITQRPPHSHVQLLNFVNKDLEVNHENIVPRKFGAIQYLSKHRLFEL